jgi:hypothetical protein
MTLGDVGGRPSSLPNGAGAYGGIGNPVTEGLTPVLISGSGTQ